MLDPSKIIRKATRDAEAIEAARARIAARRWQAETGGTTVAGIPVHTDERTRTNILGAYQEALEDPDFVVLWKGADGQFVPLDAPTIIAIAKAIRAHVQACFTREAELLDALERGQPYDLDAGWP